MLLDRDNRELLAISPGAERIACRAVGGGMRWERVTAYVPMHPDGVALELRCVERAVHRVDLAPQPPRVRIDAVHADDSKFRVQWSAQHDRPVSFYVAFIDGDKRAFLVASAICDREIEVDTARYPGGEDCRFAALATDGLRSAHVESEPVRVEEKPFRPTIIRPGPDDVLSPDQPVSMCGHAYAIGGRAAPDKLLRWSIDGKEVAAGARLVACQPLAPGEHRVTLSLADAKEEGPSAELIVRVRERTPGTYQGSCPLVVLS